MLTATRPGVPAQGIEAGEYEIKAAFLLNFAKFVDWPKQAFASPSQPIQICVLGASPAASTLSHLVGGASVTGRALVSRWISDAQEAKSCHILFISASEKGRARSLLAALDRTCVLTVGETEDFLSEGGMVSFLISDGHVRFAIDAAAASQAKLRVSSKLLSLATRGGK